MQFLLITNTGMPRVTEQSLASNKICRYGTQIAVQHNVPAARWPARAASAARAALSASLSLARAAASTCVCLAPDDLVSVAHPPTADT